MQNDKEGPRYFIYSLSKGLSLLQIMTERGVPLTLSQIAEAMDTNKAAITRFCHTLLELGFLRKDKQKRYHLTPRVLSLGYPVICNLDWRDIAEYYLNRLFHEINETVNLAILEGCDILYVLRTRREKYLPFDIAIGTKLPVYCTAMGKVLMAMGDPERVEPILANIEFKNFTESTITNIDDFLRELEVVRQKGYAVNVSELSSGNFALAAPVMNRHGHAVASVNVAVPATRFSREEMEEQLAHRIIKLGEDITKSLQRVDSPFLASGTL